MGPNSVKVMSQDLEDFKGGQCLEQNEPRKSIGKWNAKGQGEGACRGRGGEMLRMKITLS